MSEAFDRLRQRAAREPLCEDISDYGDEWCAGYLAGQTNAIDYLAETLETARAFVEWHLRGQSKPRTPDSFYPMTYAQQEAWHDEWDKRLAALIEAVAADRVSP